MNQILQNNELLSVRCEEVSLEEGYEIANKLLSAMPTYAVGLAANQIGIPKRVCVIDVTKSMCLINPKIIKASGSVLYREGCVSFPGEEVVTQRFSSITILADNYAAPLTFNKENLLECVCVQHEIDHLNGVTMFDRQHKK